MTIREADVLAIETVEPAETFVSGISWGAIIGGAVAAVATSLILMLVGSGVGLTMASPWSYAGVSATTFAVSSIIWLVVVQWLSSATGGYLAGRLRKRWQGVNADEVTFRDTAHGFLSWALATIVVATLLTSAVSAITGTAVQTAATVAGGAAQGAAQGATQVAGAAATDPSAYFVDALFRRPAGATTSATPAPADGAAAQATAPAPETTPATGSGATTPAAPDASAAQATSQSTPAASPGANPSLQASADNGAEVRGEAGRIFANAAIAGEMPDADKAYLSQLVAEQTGLGQAEAQARVDEVLAQVEAAKAKVTEAADEARKAAATLAILMALALVLGAFIASVAAALGGRQRDAV